MIVRAPKLQRLKTTHALSSEIKLDVLIVGDVRVDATLTLMPRADADTFVGAAKWLRRIPAALVRRFAVVEAGKTREGVRASWSRRRNTWPVHDDPHHGRVAGSREGIEVEFIDVENPA